MSQKCKWDLLHLKKHTNYWFILNSTQKITWFKITVLILIINGSCSSRNISILVSRQYVSLFSSITTSISLFLTSDRKGSADAIISFYMYDVNKFHWLCIRLEDLLLELPFQQSNSSNDLKHDGYAVNLVFLKQFGKFAKSCQKMYFLHQVPKPELKMFLI